MTVKGVYRCKYCGSLTTIPPDEQISPADYCDHPVQFAGPLSAPVHIPAMAISGILTVTNVNRPLLKRFMKLGEIRAHNESIANAVISEQAAKILDTDLQVKALQNGKKNYLSLIREVIKYAIRPTPNNEASLRSELHLFNRYSGLSEIQFHEIK